MIIHSLFFGRYNLLFSKKKSRQMTSRPPPKKIDISNSARSMIRSTTYDILYLEEKKKSTKRALLLTSFLAFFLSLFV